MNPGGMQNVPIGTQNMNRGMDNNMMPGTMDNMMPNTMPGMQPNMTPGMMPNMTPGMQPNMNPGMMPNMMPGMQPNMAPGMMPNMMPGMMPNMNPGMMPNMTPGMMPNMMPGMMPNMMPGMMPNMMPSAPMNMLPGSQGYMTPEMQEDAYPELEYYYNPSMPDNYPTYQGVPNMYVPNTNSYTAPMGIPMFPLYGYDNSADLDKDVEYMKHLYPSTAKSIQSEVNDECDKMEYDGSMMFDEYPDRIYLDRIIDRIYDRVKDINEEPQVEMNSLYFYPPRRRHDHFRDIINLILLNEIFNRRRRHRSRRRWF
jgi:hypothetical protein